MAEKSELELAKEAYATENARSIREHMDKQDRHMREQTANMTVTKYEQDARDAEQDDKR